MRTLLMTVLMAVALMLTGCATTSSQQGGEDHAHGDAAAHSHDAGDKAHSHDGADQGQCCGSCKPKKEEASCCGSCGGGEKADAEKKDDGEKKAECDGSKKAAEKKADAEEKKPSCCGSCGG